MEIMAINSPMAKDFTTKKTYCHQLSSDLLIDGDYQRLLSMARQTRFCGCHAYGQGVYS